MVNKQSDPVYILAETIIDSVQQIATSKTDKAAYDKTYSAIILGTNQKFTDDVSEQDKTAIIEKFSIPEAVEEGEQTYYTFKINGAYYCKKQNGNFKLYDNIMVYIPNGDWSNMYFDYPDASSHGGGGGGSGEERQLIVSVDAPGGAEPKLGDMWLIVNDENKTTFDELTPEDYTNMYTWQEDEDTGVQSWKSANCTVGGDNPPSGGVAGDLWIKLEDDLFSKIYLCTSATGSTVWSEVYPDDETGAGYNLYISADKPLSESDYWIRIDGETTQNILSFSEYKFDEDNNKYVWQLLCNVKAGGNKTIVSVDAPESPNEGCFLVTMPDTSTVTNLSRYIDGRWVDVNFLYGTTLPAPIPDTYYCIVAAGALRYILDGNNSWTAISPTPYPFFINEAPDVNPGDYWIKISDLNFRIAQTTYQYINGEWVEQYKFGATLGNGLEYDSEGKLQAKLGEGLTFDSNGAIAMTYNPVINIAHALVYKKESQE